MRPRYKITGFPVWNLVLAFLTFSEAVARGALPVLAWSKRYDGTANGTDKAYALATDACGNVYVAGGSDGVGSSEDWVTIAYSKAGVGLWTNRYNGPANDVDVPRAIAVGMDTNVYVTGWSAAGTNTDCLTIAYSRTGVPLWTNRFKGSSTGSNAGYGIAVARSGEIYVAGSCTGENTSSRFMTIAFSASGAPLWTNFYAGPSQNASSAEAIAVGLNGNVYVTGASQTQGPDFDDRDYATVAYASTGAALWTNLYNGTNDGPDTPADIAVGPDGTVYVTGWSDGGGTFDDYVTIAYSGEGLPLWTNRYDGPAGLYDDAAALAVDDHGNVYVTGYGDGNIWSLSFDCITIAYSRSGKVLWTNVYRGAALSDHRGLAIALDGRGQVYVAGYSYGVGTGFDYLLLGYSAGGKPVSTNRYDGPAHRYDWMYRHCLSVGPDGSAYLTGFSDRNPEGLQNYDYATVRFVAPPDILLQAIPTSANCPVQLSITAPSNTAYSLLTSTNLTNWQMLTNFPPLPVPSINYTDTLAPGFVQRFYRAVWSP